MTPSKRSPCLQALQRRVTTTGIVSRLSTTAAIHPASVAAPAPHAVAHSVRPPHPPPRPHPPSLLATHTTPICTIGRHHQVGHQRQHTEAHRGGEGGDQWHDSVPRQHPPALASGGRLGGKGVRLPRTIVTLGFTYLASPGTLNGNPAVIDVNANVNTPPSRPATMSLS